MSSDRSTEALVARLVDEVRPVRRVPALRSQIAWVTVAWLVTGAGAAAWIGLHPAASVQRGAVSAGIAGALVVTAFAALVAALAGRTPGRERLAAGAAVAAAAALAMLAAASLALDGARPGDDFLARCLGCAGRALVLAIPSAVAAIALALRGAGWRAGRTGAALAVGAAALGALLVHLSCPSIEPRHWLVAHAALPLVGGGGLGLLAARWLRAADERAGRRDGA